MGKRGPIPKIKLPVAKPKPVKKKILCFNASNADWKNYLNGDAFMPKCNSDAFIKKCDDDYEVYLNDVARKTSYRTI